LMFYVWTGTTSVDDALSLGLNSDSPVVTYFSFTPKREGFYDSARRMLVGSPGGGYQLIGPAVADNTWYFVEVTFAAGTNASQIVVRLADTLAVHASGTFTQSPFGLDCQYISHGHEGGSGSPGIETKYASVQVCAGVISGALAATQGANTMSASGSVGAGGPTELVLDTFTGSGDLTTHTGEIGATWATTSDLSWYFGGTFGALSDYVLNGTGGAYCTDHSTTAVVFPSGATDVGDTDFTLELDFKVGTSGEWAPYFGFMGSSASSYIVGVSMNTASPHDLSVAIGKDSTTTPYTSLLTFGFTTASGEVTSNVVHTIKITSDGADKEVFFDGVSQGTFSDATYTHGKVWMAGWHTDNDSEFSRIRVEGHAV
jgi:hypothetical protein